MNLEIIKALIVNHLSTITTLATILVVIWALLLGWLLFIKAKQGKKRSLIIVFIRVCFLAGIFLLALTAVSYIEALYSIPIIRITVNVMTLFSMHLSIIVTLSAFSELYLNRELINKKIKDEHNNERFEEEKRGNQFDLKVMPKISKSEQFFPQPEQEYGSRQFRLLLRKTAFYLIKPIYYFARLFYRHGLIYLIGLILILTLFTVVKAPYFSVSFTGDHTMKYNTHVEPAMYMHEQNDPFWYQVKYRVDPVNNPQGIRSAFSSPPLLEWGLFTTFKLMPAKSLEYNTRLFMHLIGLCILLASYILFAWLFTKNEALLITFLIAINPIINFISFVTVEDSLLILFTLLSLICLVKHIKKSNLAYLFFAGLFFGIGNASKFSIFLWLFPIITLMLAFYSRKTYIFLRDITLVFIISIVPILVVRTSVSSLPADPVNSLIRLSLWIAALYLSYKMIIKFESLLSELFQKIVTRKHYLITALALSFIAALLFLNYINLHRLANEFLTDSSLIFNWPMYQYIINEQLKGYTTANVYYLGITGFFYVFLIAGRKYKIVLLAFLSGTVIYLLAASKVIFFHNYYTGIMMIPFSLSIALAFTMLRISLQNKFITIYMLLTLLVFIYPASLYYNTARLSSERPKMDQFYQVADYLMNNTKDDHIYIDDSYLLTLTIMTGRGRVEEYHLANDTIRQSVKEIGFASTMEKFGVVYLLTTRETPRYERYVNLFSEEKLATVAYRRSDLIQAILDPSYEYFPDMELRQEIIDRKKIEDKFILEQEFGPYKIYSFKD